MSTYQLLATKLNKLLVFILKSKFIGVIIFIILTFPNLALGQSSTFTLNAAAKTSAGVYTKDGVLIRTLWSLVKYDAGTYNITWDGKDDNGNQMQSGNYVVKVVSNNIKYTWDGVVGNTSTSQTGSTVHRGLYYFMTSMSIINNTAYYSSGYSEGRPSVFKFSTLKPQEKLDLEPYRTTTANTDIVVNDGKTTYWAGFDPYAPSTSNVTWVFGKKISDDSDITFSGGITFKPVHARKYNAIGYLDQPNSIISGLAVQKNGNYLFIARAGMNKLYVLNKTTGNIVQTISTSSPKALCMDANDNLWMITGKNTLAKYTVNADGTISAPTLNVYGLLQPIALAVSPDNSTLAVADGDITSQQVKAYGNSTGNSLWTLGDAGGYLNDPTVTNNKFYFNDVRGKMYEQGFPGFLVFITYQPDGSFWVNDPGNFRVQHYDANRNYINNIMSLGPSYSTWADRNDLSRVGSEYLEFKVNNTTQVSGNTGWTLVKNWGATVDRKYDQFTKFRFINTYTSNNVSRTFGYLRNAGANQNALYELVEFPSGNKPLRFTGIIKEASTIDKSGALLTDDLRRYEFKGFDASNNPVWSNVGEKLADISQLNDKGPLPIEGFRSDYVTSNNKVVFYNYSTDNSKGYHLGVIQRGDNKWLWKTGKSTLVNYSGSFPGPDYFDIGNTVNNYAGSLAMVSDSSIITGYHGEFWKQGQTNKYNHYLDNGLAIGQFGTATGEFDFNLQSPAMMAGNTLTPWLVKGANDDELYLWHGDESWHAGLHKWKITGMKSIVVQNINITYPTPLLSLLALPGIDLMADIPINTSLSGAVGRWTFGKSATGTSSAASNKLSYDRLDVIINYSSADATSAGVFQVPCNLGTNSNLSNWKITGLINYAYSDQQGQMKEYMDVLDNAGKIIARISNTFNYVNDLGASTNTVYGNGIALVSDKISIMEQIMNNFQPVEISIANNNVIIKYAGNTITTTKFDLTADITSPKTLRVYFQGGYNPTGRSFDLKDMRFIASSKQEQTIDAGSINDKISSLVPFILNATATSGLPVTYTLISGPAKLVGNLITLTGVGTIVVKIEQPGNENYSAAPPVLKTLVILPIRVDL